MKKWILLLSLFLLLPKLALSATYTVCASGCDHTTIQAAINGHVLTTDDIVEVRADTPGGTATFAEQVAWYSTDNGTAGHPVVLRGRAGDIINITGSDTRDNCLVMTGVSYATVQNIRFHDAVYSGVQIQSASDHIIIQDCIAYDNGWWGIAFSDDGGADTNCYAYRNICYGNLNYGGLGGKINTAGEISGNICYSNGDDSWADHGIYISSNSKNMVVKNNLSYSNAAVGIKVGSNTTGITIAYNVTYSNGRAGILIDTPTSGIDIYNNTDYSSLNGLYLVASDTNITVDNVKNNIFYAADEYGVRLTEGTGAAVITTFTNNDVDAGVGGDYEITTGSINGSANNPTGSNGNISVDPLFVSATNFHILAGSPCKDTGTPVGLTQDKDGIPVPVGTGVDIGAYEYFGTFLGTGITFRGGSAQ